MKKLTVFMLTICLFLLSSCSSQPFDTEGTDSSTTAKPSFSTGDAQIVSTVSRESVTEPIVCSYHGGTITVNAPVYPTIAYDESAYPRKIQAIVSYLCGAMRL